MTSNTSLDLITSEYKRQFIEVILGKMETSLDNKQLTELNRCLNKHTSNLTISNKPDNVDLDYDTTNKQLIKDFIKTKKLKGLSKKSLYYYETTLHRFREWSIKSFLELTSNDIKEYLKFTKNLNNCTNVTLNNYRRILSAFYKWLEVEEKIIFNPIKQTPNIKTPKKVRKAFSDEEVEIMRSKLHLTNKKNGNGITRNIAIFELLLSSGLRLSEVSSLKKDSINLGECKGIVLGKGGKERIFYFSERCKIALQEYLDARVDDKEWLFVRSFSPYNKLHGNSISGMLRGLGERSNIGNVHPHRFRRTLATRLIRKGMPLQQVSKILGHESLSVTMRYIETDKELLRLIHKKHTN